MGQVLRWGETLGGDVWGRWEECCGLKGSGKQIVRESANDDEWRTSGAGFRSKLWDFNRSPLSGSIQDVLHTA